MPNVTCIIAAPINELVAKREIADSLVRLEAIQRQDIAVNVEIANILLSEISNGYICKKTAEIKALR